MSEDLEAKDAEIESWKEVAAEHQAASNEIADLYYALRDKLKDLHDWCVSTRQSGHTYGFDRDGYLAALTVVETELKKALGLIPSPAHLVDPSALGAPLYANGEPVGTSETSDLPAILAERNYQ